MSSPLTLFFAPLACSLASRICFYEAGYAARYRQVETKSKKLIDGSDYLAINPLGQVPALATESGEILTENAAVLQYIAEFLAPMLQLAPTSGFERSRLQQWLGFIGTELHKAIFVPLLDPDASESVKSYARANIPPRCDVIESRLSRHEYLLSSYSIADAYLLTVLNWSAATQEDFSPWPSLAAFKRRMMAREHVTRAVSEELALYKLEMMRARRQ